LLLGFGQKGIPRQRRRYKMSNGQTLSPARMADINIKCYSKELSCIRTKAAGAIIFNLLRNFHNDSKNELDVAKAPENDCRSLNKL